VRLRQIGWLAGIVAGLTVSLSADTLILRDGRRVQGDLISVRDGVVEFEGQRGIFGRERMRIDRDEVIRIELDEPRTTSRGRDQRNEYGGRPSGMRERDVNVNAAERWTDTGVNVRAGQTIYVSANGKVRWGPGRQDGPAGEHNSPRNDARPIPSRPAAALIGRIGDGDYFFIGDDTDAIRMRDSGRLYLGINDDYLHDNSGAFRVTVYY
jgi:PA-IL-like protein